MIQWKGKKSLMKLWAERSNCVDFREVEADHLKEDITEGKIVGNLLEKSKIKLLPTSVKDIEQQVHLNIMLILNILSINLSREDNLQVLLLMLKIIKTFLLNLMILIHNTTIKNLTNMKEHLNMRVTVHMNKNWKKDHQLQQLILLSMKISISMIFWRNTTPMHKFKESKMMLALWNNYVNQKVDASIAKFLQVTKIGPHLLQSKILKLVIFGKLGGKVDRNSLTIQGADKQVRKM